MFDKKKSAAKDMIEPAMVTRLLVVSFFIALSLGLIEGANIKLLATPFLPDAAASMVMRGLVLALSVTILVGFFRKPAALILAMLVFWPSYMTLYAGGDVSAFWRDLALIGGLIMSAAETAKADAHDGEPLEQAGTMEVVSFAPEPVHNVDTADDGAYREDFNIARSV